MALAAGLTGARNDHSGLETVRLHGLKSQVSSVGFGNVHRYGETLPRAGNLLIETKAALTKPVHECLGRARPVILDGYGHSIVDGRDD